MCWHGDEVDEGSSEVRLLLLSFVKRSPQRRAQATASGSLPAAPLFSQDCVLRNVSASKLGQLQPFVFTNLEAHLFVAAAFSCYLWRYKTFFLRLLAEMSPPRLVALTF